MRCGSQTNVCGPDHFKTQYFYLRCDAFGSREQAGRNCRIKHLFQCFTNVFFKAKRENCLTVLHTWHQVLQRKEKHPHTQIEGKGQAAFADSSFECHNILLHLVFVPIEFCLNPSCRVRFGSRENPSSQPPLRAAPRSEAASARLDCRSGVRLKHMLQMFIHS